jgi:hypothetical protein
MRQKESGAILVHIAPPPQGSFIARDGVTAPFLPLFELRTQPAISIFIIILSISFLNFDFPQEGFGDK